MALGIALFAPFAASDGTLLSEYSIPTGGSWEAPGGGGGALLEVRDGRAAPVDAGALIAQVDEDAAVPLVVGSEVYCDILNPASLPTLTNSWVGFFFWGDSTTSRLFFECYRLIGGRMQTVLRQEAEGSQQTIPTVNHPEGEFLRYGITIVSGTEITVWTEPAGGGTRTDHGTFDLDADWLDEARGYVGIAYSNIVDTTPRWDNLTVISEVEAVLPVAEFTHEVDEFEVEFTDASTSLETTIVGWAWDFGDEGSSTDQHPTHTYAENGTYTVRLTITDDEENEVFVEHDVVVNVEEPEEDEGCFPTTYSCQTADVPMATTVSADAPAMTCIGSNNIIVVDDSCVGVGVVEADEWILGDGSLLGQTGLEIG